MDSVTKMKISTEQINSIVQQAFGNKIISAVELSDGWANSAYDLLMIDGRTAILKAAPLKDIPVMRYENKIMTAEVEVLKLVGQQSRVPVPEVHLHDASCTIIPTEYFIMEKLNGSPYNHVKDSLSEQERKSIEYELGKYNAVINEIKGEKFGYFAQMEQGRAHWQDAFYEMISGVLADGRDANVELPASYAVIEQEIASRMDCLVEVQEPKLVHWDLWDGNVFVHDKQISGIIDFERAMWGDHLIEHYFSHFGPSNAFEQGYGQGPLTANEQARRALYDLYLDLILLIECDYRQYSNESHVKWAQDNMAAGWARFISLKL
ncbi:MAG: phosphotransferase family protein [Candidatus Pristimantibacillus sp.]